MPVPVSETQSEIYWPGRRSRALAARSSSHLLAVPIVMRRPSGIASHAENSHQPFRRRERAMQRFRSTKTLQKFSSVHAAVHNHFNHERHLVSREIYKGRRSAAMAEWRALLIAPWIWNCRTQ
jgi:transposase-like protein